VNFGNHLIPIEIGLLQQTEAPVKRHVVDKSNVRAALYLF
jgi:hypothetical protein